MTGRELIDRIVELSASDDSDAQSIQAFLDDNPDIEDAVKALDTSDACWALLEGEIDDEDIKESLENLKQTIGAGQPPDAPTVPNPADPNPAAAAPKPDAADQSEDPQPDPEPVAEISYLEFLARRRDDHPDIARLYTALNKVGYDKEGVEGGRNLEKRKIVNAIQNAPLATVSFKRNALLRWASITYDDYMARYTPDGGNDRQREGSAYEVSVENWRLIPAAIGAIIAGGFFIIGFVVWDVERLRMMAEVDIARGFITLLFAVGSLSIFLVVTAAVIFDYSNEGQQVYERSKTILSMLLGIFGTVLGYYFGLQDGDAAAEISIAEVAATIPEASASMNVGATVVGGAPGFDVIVTVREVGGNLVPDLTQTFQASKRSIVLDQPIDISSVRGKEISLNIFVTDSQDQTASTSSDTIAVPDS